jgi:ribose transport system substrate-binding protein
MLVLSIAVFAQVDSVFAAASGGSGKKLRIGFVVHVTGTEVMSLFQYGAEAAGEDYNAEVIYTGPVNADNTEQIAQFDSLVATNPDGMVMIAGDPAVWDRPIKNAVDKGIPVIIVDNDAPSSARIAYYGVDAWALANKLGKAVREITGDKGKIGLGVCLLGPEAHAKRAQGVIDAFKGTPMEFIGPYETKEDTTLNYNTWENIYTANPNLTALVGLSATETVNLGRLKRQEGGDVIMASFDPGAEGLTLLQEGYLNVVVGQNIFLAGYLSVQAIARNIQEGYKIEPGVHYYEGEVIRPKDAAALIVRESGRDEMTKWYRQYIKDNNLTTFGLSK